MRWSDMDAQGHVNNVAIVDFLQEARVAFFRAGPASTLLADGVVVVSHQVVYLGSVAYSDRPLTIGLGVSSLGASRFEIAYELRQDERLVGKARTVLCPFNFATNRPARIPSDIHSFLAGYVVEAERFTVLDAPPLGQRGTTTDLFVRWSDNDAFGHVNNSVAFDYVQQARVSATTDWDPTMARAGDSSHLWLVARQDVDYVAQMSNRLTPYVARTAPVRLGNSSITLACEISDPDDGSVLTRARTVLVCADSHFRPVPLPATTRARLAQELVD